MENQTLTSLCPYCWVTWIIAHEFAHQWFGDMITCGTWADVWLNESFATWCEASYDEHNGGYTSYKNDIVGDANDYLAYNPGWAISNPAWAVNTPPMGVLFNTQITYEKGACVLHMLRHILGDGPFFATLQAYCADTNLKFKSAVTSDFTAVINRVTSADYSWFINQWIYYPNHPNYLNNYFYEDHGNGHWTVAFLTTQVQTNAPFFKMPMELSIHFASGSDTLITVMNDVNTQEYNWTFNRQPLTLTFDPNNDIVLKQASTVQGKVWTGSVSDDWNVAGNWNLSGVPTTESARIPTVSTHMPVVKNTGMSCGSLSIEAGATLTINAGKNLTVNGKLLVAGSTSMVLKP
jgi:aminopeptidase N